MIAFSDSIVGYDISISNGSDVMGWELKASPKTYKATAKLAKEFAEMEAAHVDRPLKERRLDVYRIMRKNNGFRPVTWAKAWCNETGQFYRVNGKHTSTLFSDGQDLDNIFVTIEEYVCDTLEDVARLYATFDSQMQTRNATDVNRSFAATVPELADFNTKFINLMVSALNYQPTHRDGTATHRTAAERAEVIFDNIQVIIWVHDLIGDSHRGEKHAAHLWRVPVVAAIIAAYHKSQKSALEFWTAVRDETGAAPDCQDRKLAKFLTTTVSHQGAHTGAPARFRTTNREYYVKCALAWNAWRKGEPTSLKYYVDAKVPSFG